MKKILVLCLTLAAMTPLFSQPADSLSTSKKRTYQLEGIRVVAERETQTIGSIAVKEFNAETAATDLNVAQSISDVNGLDIITGGKSGSTVSIRGFQNDQIKFFLDGRPLGGGYFGNVDLNTIPVSEIKNIQILKGPVSALYGSDTMGGVVNIVSRSVHDQPLLKVGSQFRRNNTNKQYLSLAKSFDLFDASIYASRYNTDGFVLSQDFEATTYENGDIRNNTARNQYDIQAKVNATIFDFNSIAIQAGYTTMDTKEIAGNIYENQLRKFIDWKRYQLSGSGAFQLNDFLASDFTLYYDAYDDTYAEFNTATGEMYSTWPSYLESWKLGLRNNYTWQLSSSWETQFGARFEKETYNRKDNGSYKTWTTNNQQTVNLFNQHEITLKPLTLTVGSGMSFFMPKGQDSWEMHIEPSASLRYGFANSAAATLSASRNTKYPVMHELFSASSGNPELKPEQATKTEMTLQWPIKIASLHGNLKQAVYYNWITNLIDKEQDVYRNFENVDTYGYECSLNLHLLWNHQWEYSLVRYGKESDYELLETPRHSVKLKESVLLPYAVRLEYKASWKDVRYYDEETTHVTLAPYWLHSMYLNKAFGPLSAKLGVENILDTNYMEKYGQPGPGMDFLINLEYRY